MRLIEHRRRFFLLAVALRLPVPDTEPIFQVALDPHFPDDILLEWEVDRRDELDQEAGSCETGLATFSGEQRGERTQACSHGNDHRRPEREPTVKYHDLVDKVRAFEKREHHNPQEHDHRRSENDDPSDDGPTIMNRRGSRFWSKTSLWGHSLVRVQAHVGVSCKDGRDSHRSAKVCE